MKIQAKVTKGAARRNDSAVFDAALPNGQTVGVWASAQTNMQEFLAVHTGAIVELSEGSKPGKYFFNRIISEGPAPAQASGNGYRQPETVADILPEMPPVEAPEMREIIREYVSRHAKLFAHCVTAAQAELGPLGEAETLRSAATTIYIQVTRKFNL